ncbi:type II toxin-antitoxin system VapC family toxin [Curvibacter sp. CHRR-16]|uniref:PIN domain-containing protein n=1 Tax=Curvibacter sp. CHRR-16 TaxID=2835872 RepID=UPI001BDACB09|nr:type II toxin-antitoxin system VapC family toxin [Curvibacter sp. CHRR-16]MBT0570189.1 type II toxin-antitoxin system VapC family toxin [Curvibacter sp. CHRR-16]
MIGLDTNVLVRYIMQDDAAQSKKATKLLESLTPTEPGFVPLVVVVELFWVLSSAYELSREQIAAALDALIHSKQLTVEKKDQVVRALRVYSASTADFPDCLIERTANAAGCERVMTFDVGAAKKAGMVLIA